MHIQITYIHVHVHNCFKKPTSSNNLLSASSVWGRQKTYLVELRQGPACTEQSPWRTEQGPGCTEQSPERAELSFGLTGRTEQGPVCTEQCPGRIEQGPVHRRKTAPYVYRRMPWAHRTRPCVTEQVLNAPVQCFRSFCAHLCSAFERPKGLLSTPV